MKPKYIYLIVLLVILLGITYLCNFGCNSITPVTKPVCDTTLRKSYYDKSKYIVKNTDSAIYIFPLSKTIFVEGILEHKETYEYFDIYKAKDMDGCVGMDDEGSPEYIDFISDKVNPTVEQGDTLSYRILAGTNGEVELEAFSIWTGKLSVGGFKVGDNKSFLQSALQINIPKSVRKIIIVNPVWNDYDSLRMEHNIPLSNRYKGKDINNTWGRLPIGIKFNIRSDSIYSIITTNINSDGSYASPFFTHDLHLLY